ncbi:Nuclear nucleic acid-binding protein C1D [Camellia lanceoleosa]|uniref:Nuclear nucleic acid-binding protein C1D n=1 Tax=Camellia lanceoleosa TaxID=1840588 RepID=A0ACC0G6W2_9ERIC|nr:Nuclear nucleic acid-binding protein C1D [Camellia lanceoleosa]
MEGGGSDNILVPESVIEVVKRISCNMEEFRTHFVDFLSLCDPQVLSEMLPLQRAQSLLLLAKATTTLFTLKLRCSGVCPDDHPVKSELERLRLYQEKLQRFIDLSKAPLRPSTTLNHQAATRFIEHSLPDLTSEQRQSMRDISRGEGPKIKYVERNVHKKRKCQSSGQQSVRTATQEFLEKAARELLGDNKNGFKGPLQPENLDEDDLSMD